MYLLRLLKTVATLELSIWSNRSSYSRAMVTCSCGKNRKMANEELWGGGVERWGLGAHQSSGMAAGPLCCTWIHCPLRLHAVPSIAAPPTLYLGWDSGSHACLASPPSLDYVCLGKGDSLEVKQRSAHYPPFRVLEVGPP